MPDRWFIAHRKGVETPFLEDYRKAARAALIELGNDPAALPELVLGVEDYEAHFAECGGWEAWAMHWAIGTESGADRYAAIVLPDRVGIKKATGGALILALRRAKPVFWFNGPGPLGDGTPSGFYPVKGLFQSGGSEQWPVYTVRFS